MKSRSFSAALFAAFVLVSFSVPSAMAGGQDPTVGQCRNVEEDWSIYRAVGNQHSFPKAERKLLEKCRAIAAAKRGNQTQKISAPVQSAWFNRIFR